MSLEWQTEALAAEFSRGQWIVPSDNGGAANHPEAATLLRDLLFYDPRRHTPDRVAAACFARWGGGAVGGAGGGWAARSHVQIGAHRRVVVSPTLPSLCRDHDDHESLLHTLPRILIG